VLLGKCSYYDLNGDGRFDAMVDDRDKERTLSYILISHSDGELETVRIQTLDRKLNILLITTEAYHSKTPYIFEKGNWRKETVEDRRRAEGKDK
jgi:hypothetical protein